MCTLYIHAVRLQNVSFVESNLDTAFKSGISFLQTSRRVASKLHIALRRSNPASADVPPRMGVGQPVSNHPGRGRKLNIVLVSLKCNTLL